MSTAVAIVGGVCLVLGAFAIFANWAGIIGRVLQRRNYSAIPIIGGLLFAAGWLLHPETRARFGGLWWVGLILDWTIPVYLTWGLRTVWKRRHREGGPG